jgi:hypothetical protein
LKEIFVIEAMTIGIVDVACFAASVAGAPQVRIRSTGRVTSSAASADWRVSSPPVDVGWTKP